MGDPFFSIVIPTYNRATTLRRAIDSVLGQDYPSFELIIIDDGSTDNTQSVVAAYPDARIKYMKQENRERAAARNSGTLMAKGVFVTFLDSDDIFLANHLSTAKRIAEENTPEIFHLGYNIVGLRGQVVKRWSPLKTPANDILLDGNYLSCLGIFIRLSIATKYLFNEDRALSGSEDYELWLRIAARHDILAFGEVTAALIEHEGRSVVAMDPDKLVKRIDLLRYYVRRNEETVTRFNAKLDRWEAFLDIYVALHLAMMGNQATTAFNYWVKALLKAPQVVVSKRFWVVPKKILT